MIVGIHRGLQTHDRIHLEQRDRRGRTSRSTFSRTPAGSASGVHFEPDLQRRRRIHVLLDNLVQAELVGPELFVAERLEAKNALALGDICGCRWCALAAGSVVAHTLNAVPAMNMLKANATCLLDEHCWVYQYVVTVPTPRESGFPRLHRCGLTGRVGYVDSGRG